MHVTGAAYSAESRLHSVIPQSVVPGYPDRYRHTQCQFRGVHIAPRDEDENGKGCGHGVKGARSSREVCRRRGSLLGLSPSDHSLAVLKRGEPHTFPEGL